ncbi:MAG TPA: lysophospholipid acyltransferase family protein [Terriglobales bacterium]|nr:lysophospholipid acyltransferase family protein [Terriglobales bacterium]
MAAWYFIIHTLAFALATVCALTDMFLRWVSAGGDVPLLRRAEWLHRWCVFALGMLGVRYEVIGTIPASGLIVANHLSYLDIMVFSAVTPTLFVSKKEVRKWPVFGLLAHLAGSRFLDRSRSADAHRVQNEVQEALDQGCRVIVFPEGTSTDGNSVLPFKPAMFESAVGRHDITVAHIAYTVSSGDAQQDVCFWGDMEFVPHLVRMLSKRWIAARIQFGTPSRFADRKQAALETNRLVTALRES